MLHSFACKSFMELCQLISKENKWREKERKNEGRGKLKPEVVGVGVEGRGWTLVDMRLMNMERVGMLEVNCEDRWWGDVEELKVESLSDGCDGRMVVPYASTTFFLYLLSTYETRRFLYHPKVYWSVVC